MDGVVVVELAGGVAGAWCGRLLRHLGAEVILAEPASGSPLRIRPPLLATGESPWHHWLNAGKSSVVVAGEAEVEELVSEADCVIQTADGTEEEGAVAERAERFRQRRPAQVLAALSAHGLTGPWRSLASSDLTEWAAGGHLLITGEADRPPVAGGGPWPAYFTATAAVVGIQAALLDAARSGSGQLVDVGAMEVMAGSHQWSITTYTHTGYVKRRDGNRLAESFHPITIYRCVDGWVQVAAASNHQWTELCIAADCVELIADDGLMVPAGRYDRADEIDAHLQPWFAARTTAEAIAPLQAARVPAGRVNDLASLLADEHLRARDQWSAVPELGREARVPGPPFQLGERQPAPPVAAPALGSSPRLPPIPTPPESGVGGSPLPEIDLTGVRVLEFGIAWAGPLAARYLADLGADVIKVEHPTSRGLGVATTDPSGDWHWGELPAASVRNGTWPATDPGERWFNRMGLFNKLQRNKRSLCLDVKAPGGDELLHRLVEQSDVVLNNYSPRGVQSLGIDHETLSSVNPDIITISMSGYGATGPLAGHFSFGPVLESHSGMASITGYPGSDPLRVGVAFPDPIGGLSGAVAALAALWRRARTGTGCAVDLSQLETLLPLIGQQLLTTSVTGEPPERPGNRSPEHAPQGVYRCAGVDAWLAVTVRSDAEWQGLVSVVGSERLEAMVAAPLADRHAHHDVIDAEIEAWSERRGKFEAMAALQSRGVAAMAVLSNADLVDGPQLQARGFIRTIESGDAGPQRVPGTPLHFSGRDTPMGRSPTLGEHNEAIVIGLLGYDHSAYSALVHDETLATAPPGG